MATDPKTMFNNLTPGDVVIIPGLVSRVLVIKTRGKDGLFKHLGQICQCGQHVYGTSNLLRWSDDLGFPVDKNSKKLDVWVDVQVEKASAEALAEKFKGLAVNDDKLSDEEAVALFKSDPRFLAALEIGRYSNAKFGVTCVAMIRTLGVPLDDNQAKLIAAVMDSNPRTNKAAQASELYALFDQISGAKH